MDLSFAFQLVDLFQQKCEKTHPCLWLCQKQEIPLMGNKEPKRCQYNNVLILCLSVCCSCCCDLIGDRFALLCCFSKLLCLLLPFSWLSGPSKKCQLSPDSPSAFHFSMRNTSTIANAAIANAIANLCKYNSCLATTGNAEVNYCKKMCRIPHNKDARVSYCNRNSQLV